MYGIKVEKNFDSAHFLTEYMGKCRNIHGHTWRVIVEVRSETLNSCGQTTGMVADFSDIKQDLSSVLEKYDHALIIEKDSIKETTLKSLEEENFKIVTVMFRPTAENFARDIHSQLSQFGHNVRRVEIYETPMNCAYYEEP